MYIPDYPEQLKKNLKQNFVPWYDNNFSVMKLNSTFPRRMLTNDLGFASVNDHTIRSTSLFPLSTTVFIKYNLQIFVLDTTSLFS